jgi:hypothetical protein
MMFVLTVLRCLFPVMDVVLRGFLVVIHGWFVANQKISLRQNSVVALFFESSPATTQSDRNFRLFAYTRGVWRSPPS